MLSPKIRCRLWADDGNNTLATPQSRTHPGLEDSASTFNKLLAAADRGGALEAVGMEIPSQSAESHSFVECTKVILKGLVVLRRVRSKDAIHSDKTLLRDANTAACQFSGSWRKLGDWLGHKLFRAETFYFSLGSTRTDHSRQLDERNLASTERLPGFAIGSGAREQSVATTSSLA